MTVSATAINGDATAVERSGRRSRRAVRHHRQGPAAGDLRLFHGTADRSVLAAGNGVKATPLVMIAVGLALCYIANIWNIGAEG
jgi:hypothetical protein